MIEREKDQDIKEDVRDSVDQLLDDQAAAPLIEKELGEASDYFDEDLIEEAEPIEDDDLTAEEVLYKKEFRYDEESLKEKPPEKKKPIEQPKPKIKKPPNPILQIIKSKVFWLSIIIALGAIAAVSFKPFYDHVYYPRQCIKKGIGLIKEKEFFKAEEVLKEALAHFRIEKHVVDAYNQFGKTYLDTGAYKWAEEKFEHSLKLDPHNVIAENGIIYLMIKNGDPYKAERRLKRLIRRHTGYLPAWINLARVLLKTNRPKGAEEILNYCIKIDQGNIDALGLYIQALVKVKDYPKALNIHKVVTRNTRGKVVCSKAALTEVGIYYMENGRSDIAADLFKEIIAHYPEAGAEARYHLAQILDKKKDWKAAINHLKIATMNAPDMDKAHNLAGEIYEREGFYDKALSKFERAITVNPKNATAHYHLAIIYFYQLKNLEKALEHYLEARKYGIDTDEQRYNMGVCNYNLGKYLDAACEWKRVLSRLKDFVVEVNIGQAEIMLHQAARVIPEYEAAAREHKDAITKGIKEDEKKERYLALSKYTNNLLVLSEIKGNEIPGGYWQALEYAAQGGGECRAAYHNMERKLRKAKLTSVLEGLCEIDEGYGYSIANKEKKRLEAEDLKKFFEEREQKEQEKEYKKWQYEAGQPKKEGHGHGGGGHGGGH
ncbi:tetratricopeptide repeat protein [Candidatus Desantisbacteria bacterium]|nr:tetratricopeptide repeat protein [Candidatus Desantisbacteria bacterium]